MAHRRGCRNIQNEKDSLSSQITLNHDEQSAFAMALNDFYDAIARKFQFFDHF